MPLWKVIVLSSSFWFGFSTCEMENITHSRVAENTTKTLTSDLIRSCETPNGDQGFCIPLKICPKLLNQIENANATQFLRASKCGVKSKSKDRTNPSVCCGKYSNYKHLVLAKVANTSLKMESSSQNFTIENRIVGGKQAALGEFPWMARLYYINKTRTKFYCTGFLISQRFVLTAAHCLKSDLQKGPVFEVHLGEHDTNTIIDCDSKNKTCADKVQIMKIKKKYLHPSYKWRSNNHHNDIGLIYLKKKPNINIYVNPISLHIGHVEPTEYWLSGWGATDTEEESPIKLKVSVKPFSHSKCTKLYKQLRLKIIDTQICAGGEKNKDSCNGDSGGPLMVVHGNKWFAVGVVSYGYGCGREKWPAVYTNITSYHEWITNTMSKAPTNSKKKNRRKN